MVMGEGAAVVVGGASGIGAATAALLVKRGVETVIADRNLERAEKLASEIGARSYGLDVTQEVEVEALAEQIEAEVGAVGMLVNSAAIFQLNAPRPEEVNFEEWDRIMAVNLRGTFACCRAFGSRMARRRHGSIVNISSIGGMRSMPLHAYGPSKAALINLTEGLAGEWGRSGVRVNAVTPGYVLTEMTRHAIDTGQRDGEKVRATTALNKLATPEDLANAIVFLLSEEAASITGVNLPVDNGYLVALSWQPFGGCRPPA